MDDSHDGLPPDDEPPTNDADGSAPEASPDLHATDETPDNLVSLFERVTAKARPAAPLTPTDEALLPDNNVIDFAAARRALEGGIPDEGFFATPLGQYVKEHILPEDFNGQGHLVLPPDFLQEHGRPLFALLLNAAADTLSKQQEELDEEALDVEEVSLEPDEASPTASSAATAPPIDAPPVSDKTAPDDASTVSGESSSDDTPVTSDGIPSKGKAPKEISLQLDLSSFFRTFFKPRSKK